MTELEETLKARGGRYGEFKDQAVIAIGLKNTLRYQWSEDLLTLAVQPGWARLEPYQQHALDIICDKLSRIINGDPRYIDNWHDIQGYARLVEDRLKAEE